MTVNFYPSFVLIGFLHMAHLNFGKVFDNDPKDKLVNTK